MKYGVLVTALLLVACAAPSPTSEQQTIYPTSNLGGVMTYTDPETKCEYLITSSGGITPRMAKTYTLEDYGKQKGC